MKESYNKMQVESEIALKQNEETQGENQKLKNIIEKLKKHLHTLQNEHSEMELKYNKIKQTLYNDVESESEEESPVKILSKKKSHFASFNNNDDLLSVDDQQGSMNGGRP
mmetsp:Transcript_6777/g.6084  ORF Transcript_6777/g.6084 Transcript_6777/m.6084 type:complete len:110 (-) Transcript_6777:373-702(-)